MAACSSTTKVVRREDSEAAREMRIADSLEAASAIHEAAVRYSSIAERFPGSRFYQTAVREAALLYNAIDDSASLHWLQVYANQPISKEEKETAIVQISLLRRIGTLQQEIDSLMQYS